jgi:formylglycine-generating enzyme required for sulfatase activity
VHAPEAHTGSGEHGPTERICVDEHLVSEMDFYKCAVCEQPTSPWAKSAQVMRKPRRRAEFCIDGKAPTTNPIRCATWKQANIYCAALAARLPTEAELHALPPALTRAPMEWTSATPEADRENRSPFRCAHDQ